MSNLDREAETKDDERGVRSAATLRTLNAFAVDVMSIRSVEDLFWYVAQNVVGQLDFVDCVIYEANSDQTKLVQVAAWGEKNPYGRAIDNPLQIEFGQGITGQAAQRSEAIVIDDLLANQNYIPDTRPARSEICVPIIMRGRVAGVIDSEHPDVEAFGDAELKVLTTVAAMTSAKLELLFESERSQQRYVDLVQSHAQLTEEVTNRKALEAELFKVRKLEAIGRLTGGFAHGFNNLLTVISGNLELIDTTTLEPGARTWLGDAKASADRGGKLIRDMLAFSQKMRLQSKLVDLNAIVTSTTTLKGRALVDEIKLDLAPDLWRVKIDPSASEIALTNLMMNAKEAMVDGGVLTIGTENVHVTMGDRNSHSSDLWPGRYVHLFVHDEGAGMTAETMQQIFDPFFTTKGLSENSGLGLSMVQGFMKQSGGAVTTQSSPAHGTTFHLYFPAADDNSNTLLT